MERMGFPLSFKKNLKSKISLFQVTNTTKNHRQYQRDQTGSVAPEILRKKVGSLSFHS